ncbi:MAG: hypothetical protein L6Q99_05055 [Planctomycetes bacterium]|nr:hypothetical protein [Planctomycetota bacterium]
MRPHIVAVRPLLTCSAVTLLASAVCAQSLELPRLAPVSNEGDPTELVLDGEHVRQVVAGRVVSTTPVSQAVSPGASAGATAAAACGTLAETFLTNAIDAEGDTPTAIAFTPDATKIVVAHRTTKSLTVLDAVTRVVLQTIPLSGSPNDLAISADGTRALTANIWEDTASLVDLNAGVELASVAVGAQPMFARFTPSGAKAVIGNAVDQSVSVIDVAAASELFRIPGAGFQSFTTIAFEPGVVVSTINGFVVPSETLAIHPDNLANQIDYFDLSAGTVTSVACATAPRGIAVTPSGSKAVVSHFGSVRKLSVIDVASQTITNVFNAPVDLDEAVAIKSDGTKAAVAVLNATMIVDLSTGVFSSSLSTAGVSRLLPTPDGLYVLAVGFNGSLISWAGPALVKNLNGVVNTYVGAVAPSGQRAALAAAAFGENLIVVNTNGAAGFLEADVPSGGTPEADNARDVEVSADGAIAVATNILSDTVSVIDLASGNVLAVVAVGDRPADVAITPDRSKAVVANLDSTFASVIDLTTFAVTPVAISTRASEVEISPNGQYAYVAVVSSGDGVWRIDLNTNTVAGGKLATGDMGSTGYLFNQTSGMTLSHDGATLAVCGSFTNVVTLIDTATWSVVANVPVTSFPVDAVFQADDSRLFVSLKNTNRVVAISNAGGASAVLATYNVGAAPGELVVDAAATELYVCNFNDKKLGVVDLSSGVMTHNLALGEYPQALAIAPSGSCVYASAGNWSVSVGPGPKVVIGTSGSVSVIDTATHTIAQVVATSLPPAALAFEPNVQLGCAASPFGDGVSRLSLAPDVTSYCTSKTNSQGCTPPIGWTGTPSASAGSGFVVSATLVRSNVNGLFFYSTIGANGAPFQGGHLCVKPPIKRTAVVNSGGSGPCGGALNYDFNTFIAGGSNPALIQGADFWGQWWSRDPLSPSTTSLTDALASTIGP